MKNAAFWSSFLFLIPVFFFNRYADVNIACCFCFITSLANHALHGKNSIIQRIDQMVVRSLACWYLLQCMLYLDAFSGLKVYMFSLATFVLYICIKLNPWLYNPWHSFVHVLAICGIVCFLIERDKITT